MDKIGRDILSGLGLALILACGVSLSVAYQAALRYAQTPKVALSPTQIFLASLPTWAVLAFLLLLFIAAVWISIAVGGRHVVRPTIEGAEPHSSELRKKITELEAKLGFPDFVATILEVQEPDQPDKTVVLDQKRVFAVIVIGVANNGAKSVVRNYKVTAQSPSGYNLNIDVINIGAFTLQLNGGKDCLDYSPEHFMVNKTYANGVERGNPITGILPCNFNGLSNLKEVDFRTLKVSFTDGTGTPDGTAKWWETAPLTEVNFSEIIPHASRPGMPRMRPCN